MRVGLFLVGGGTRSGFGQERKSAETKLLDSV